MNRQRLDQALVSRGLVRTRSQAESFIKLGKVKVEGRVVTKPARFVSQQDDIRINAGVQYVSRAALKLLSVSKALKLDFKDKVVLDVGSSTGGFTEVSLEHGAKKVIAVDVGSDQLHPSLRGNPRIELHEKTDIRNFVPRTAPGIILIDVSFISLRDVLPHLARLASEKTEIVAMLKPQFEAGAEEVHKGVIKNDTIRRKILRDFESWTKKLFIIVTKADSEVAGAKGNLERFYLLKTRLKSQA